MLSQHLRNLRRPNAVFSGRARHTGGLRDWLSRAPLQHPVRQPFKPLSHPLLGFTRPSPTAALASGPSPARRQRRLLSRMQCLAPRAGDCAAASRQTAWPVTSRLRESANHQPSLLHGCLTLLFSGRGHQQWRKDENCASRAPLQLVVMLPLDKVTPYALYCGQGLWFCSQVLASSSVG